MIALSLLPLLLLATTAVAAPTRRDSTIRGDHCNVPASAVTLPSSLDPLPSPPNLFLLGVGVQNYTCSSNGTFDNVGAVAQLFEISCLFGRPGFSSIPNVAFNDWAASPITNPLDPGLVQQVKNKYNINVEGQHYFVQQNGTLVPVWDLRSSGENAGNPNAIVFAQKVNSATSPNGPGNIDWVELKKLSGGLANLVYRVETVKGQPPSTCTPGSSASVKYTANYLFF
ncbi:hypothetical protein F5888DRAFT_1800292 [Russula emetica]|nr:hypothetical protein F5888DRAFT_1800292 [Russula emetica]